jgi:hypothetical protein
MNGYATADERRWTQIKKQQNPPRKVQGHLEISGLCQYGGFAAERICVHLRPSAVKLF